jgi:hypothetical protein
MRNTAFGGARKDLNSLCSRTVSHIIKKGLVISRKKRPSKREKQPIPGLINRIDSLSLYIKQSRS